MQLTFGRFETRLAHKWTIANKLGPGGGGGMNTAPVLLLELKDESGVIGRGESAPSSRYQEDLNTTEAYLAKVDGSQLSFADLEASLAYLEKLAPGNYVPKGALNMALLDGAAKLARKPVYDFLGLGFTENKHVTSFSIGIDQPDKIRAKVLEADAFPVLKLKVGSPNDRANFQALREAAPKKWVRVDANEGWKTKEEALRHLEWLAADGYVQFVEQPMPDRAADADWQWLKERSPLPIMADESYLFAQNVERCASCFHAVNVKLMKCGGILPALRALQAARQAGLKTMIGCMIETSLLITAAAHLAELADYLDIDGNLLITNDPFLGVTAEQGKLSFSKAREPYGLRVCPSAS